ncbi:MAG: hypothetical protein CFH16_00823 [Alphaproteobacteria bacterium MarineAlpha5_Bin6]|nr:MAG: hypothetical protein CFH17_00782 [Alphaproteobacteria bacterium MarineAlpha5_Bin7]PPR53790.1 MAG: hypothetical protein CFH16_00823 [Alphaproteobacteria bacterium MarineAlpha5_Bin6]|tara:strand:+ start:1129 stop:1731 length:603 start_codon:yes stop_codon:yes gene_type:complete
MDFLFSYINEFLLYTNEFYLRSYFLFFIFLFLYATTSFPGFIIFSALSGYLYGTYYGYLISIISLTLGSLVFFLISKNFFKFFFYKYYEKYSNNINKYIQKSSIEYLIIFRMIPGAPLGIQNFLLSLLNINISKFIFVTFIGFTPYIFASTFIGNKINNINLIKELKFNDILSLDLIILIVILLVILFVRIKYKNKKKPS